MLWLAGELIPALPEALQAGTSGPSCVPRICHQPRALITRTVPHFLGAGRCNMHESACVTGSRTALQALKGQFGEGKGAACLDAEKLDTGMPEIGASSERGIPTCDSGPPVGLGRAVVSGLACVTMS